mmetsp:Transcript_36449/g.113553  ORF Transcript_36449/g.113553 Transcript_36449/m.113553 type:complete len:317 (+) Transcript_36449:167-1117(+)
MGDVPLHHPLVDQVGQHALHLLGVGLSPSSFDGAHEDVELDLIVGWLDDMIGLLEEVAIHAKLQLVEEDVDRLLHEEILMLLQGLVEEPNIAIAKRQHELLELLQLILVQQGLSWQRSSPGWGGTTLVEDQADGDEVTQDQPAVGHVVGRAVVEGEREVGLSLVEATLHQRHPPLEEIPRYPVWRGILVEGQHGRKHKRLNVFERVEREEHLVALICHKQGSVSPRHVPVIVFVPKLLGQALPHYPPSSFQLVCFGSLALRSKLLVCLISKSSQIDQENLEHWKPHAVEILEQSHEGLYCCLLMGVCLRQVPVALP